MKTATIYCRVSTEDQEREGTSLQTQLEACLNYCKDKSYNVAYRFSEAYSGLTLERPKLNELRELVRAGDIDVIVIYCLDRLSRDPTHGVILTQELERHHVTLEAVTETVDSSELGKLISYIRGFASKLEVEKIKERTGRGLRMRALSGKFPSGKRGQLYGYHYIKGKGEGQGIRVPNEDEARVVRSMYSWLVEEGLSVYAIVKRLKALGIPNPSGGDVWGRSSVHWILSNPAYCGKTYCFTQSRTESNARRKPNSRYRKTHNLLRPREEWIEIPNATPPVISEDVFQQAQERLRRNKELAVRNMKRSYMLRGFIKCSRCRRNWVGQTTRSGNDGTRRERSYYHCSACNALLGPRRCHSKWYPAQNLEQIVWEQIEAILANPEVVLAEINRRQEQHRQTEVLESKLDTVRIQLANREKQKARVWKAFEITGDELTFRKSIALLETEVKELLNEELHLQKEIAANTQFNLDADGIRRTCELVRQNLKSLRFEDKRLALEALQITIWIDDDKVSIEGAIPVLETTIVSNPALSPGL